MKTRIFLLATCMFFMLASIQLHAHKKNPIFILKRPVPPVEIKVGPIESDAIVYQEVSPAFPGDAATAQLSIFMVIENKGKKAIGISKIVLQNKQVAKTFAVKKSTSWKTPNPIPPGKFTMWQNGREYYVMGNVIQLKKPYPREQVIKVYFKGYRRPVTIKKALKPYRGPVLQFPGKAEDLGVNEYWSGWSRHGSNSGQVFGLDLGVTGWDGKKWSEFHTGKNGRENAHFRIYGKPVYAMADGVVKDFKNTHPDNPKPKVVVAPKPAAGNHFIIDHGNFSMTYSHCQKGSLNKKLLKKGAKVKKGDFLALAGNSGSAPFPHLHIHILGVDKAINPRDNRPLRLYGADVVAVSKIPNPSHTGNWVPLRNNTIPTTMSLIRPTTGQNWREYSRVAVRGAYYQGEFDKLAKAGYYPSWINGFEYRGTTYFNVSFQPANGRAWVARHNINGKTFQTEFNKYTKKGFRPIHVDSYVANGKVRYAVVYMKKGGPGYIMYHGASRSYHQKRFGELAKKGWAPSHVSAVTLKGRSYFTAIYEKKNVGGFYHYFGMTASGYQSKYNEMAKKGYQPIYLDVYNPGRKPRFSAIWYKRPPYAGHMARHGLRSGPFLEAFHKNTKARYYSRCLVGYQTGGKPYYAGIWAKDKPRLAIKP